MDALRKLPIDGNGKHETVVLMTSGPGSIRFTALLSVVPSRSKPLPASVLTSPEIDCIGLATWLPMKIRPIGAMLEPLPDGR